MASSRMQFILDGRDHLSRVLDRAGDSANRLGRRLLIAQIEGDAAMRRLGRTTTQHMAGLQRDTDLGGKAAEALKASLISLAPAAVPLASSLAPIAAGAGAVAVSVGAFTAALVPQISALSEAADAEQKYEDAVTKSGKTSEAAIGAQLEYQQAMAKLPPETRKAAAALGILKDEFKGWSDALAGDTMPVFTKGLAVANALLPKTEGLVKGTSRELDRMVTLLGGGMETPGFDRVSSKFTTFANNTLRKVDDQLVHLMRTTDMGKVGGGLSEFMDYARAQGPVVADTLRNVGTALGHVLSATSDVGVGMLDIVNALTGIVSAIPPDAIAAVLQLVVALKAAKLAAVGMAAGRTALAAFGAQLVAMQTAAAAATGRMAVLSAAIGTLSRGAKIALAGTGIGLLVIALGSLSAMGKKAPPDVDRLTTSLGQLARTGKISGEAAKAFGTDLGGLAESLRTLSRPSNLDSTQQFLTKLIGMDSTPVKEAKQDLEAVDKALAGLVQGGKSEIAAAAFDKLAAGMKKNGMSAGELRDKLDGYKSALADQAFEQQLAAASMGLFGAQAQQVQTKLDAQKASADGLRQSISALNESHRQGLGGMIGFEAAIDAATKAIKGNETALSMSGGQLNLTSEKARTAATALNDLAAKTDEAAGQARQSGASWETVNGIYARGRARLIASADAMGLNTTEARRLADQILRTPDKTARLKGNLEDLESKLSSAKSQLAKVPDSRKAAIRAQISDLQEKVRQAKAALATVQDKTVSVMVNYRSSQNPSSFAKSIGGYASGGKPKPGELAWVGEEGPELMRFGGGGTEIYDHRSSMAMVADASAAGRDAGLGLRRGMTVSTGAVEKSGRSLAGAILYGVRDELQIASPSKKMKALMADVGKGIIIGLTGTKAKISATAKDLVKDIWKAWEGVKTSKDSKLVQMVNRDTKKLQKLATNRDKIAAKLADAKAYREQLRSTSQQAFELGNLGLQDEEVSAGSIQAGLQEKLNKANRFGRYIASLAKRGLNKNLLKQVIDMGPDAGYAYASALAGMSKSALSAVSATQTSLDRAATNLSAQGADLMYDSGKQAGKGFLTGLTSQQKAIEDQMVKIAKGMQKAIKKALGIKSPSRVMAQLGRYTTEGLAVGLTERMPVLDRALGAVTNRVASAQPVIGRPAVVGGGAGAQPVQIQIDVHGAMDPVAVGRELQRVLLQLKRTQGVNVNLGLA